LKLPTLATIGLIQGDSPSPNHMLATLDDEKSEVADAFRMVRTSLMPGKPGAPSGPLLVTSAAPAEGKTTSACNLATTVALAGKRVILCDADMRRPRVHDVFGLPNRGGLSTLLLDGTEAVDSMLLEAETSGLRILPAGPRPASPADLLGSAAMQQRVLELQELADIIIFDTPAVLAVTDAVALASLCSTAIIVVDAARMRMGPAQAAVAALDQSGLPVHGVVLNKVKRRRSRHYAYYSDPGTWPERPDLSGGSAPAGWRALVERFARPLRWPKLPGSTLP
jgi:capsular exopolysaccharide synthesis family protein